MESLYTIEEFKATLSKAKKVYCSNDLEYGVRLLPVNIALNHHYIQVNSQKVLKALVIDIDHDDLMIFDGKVAPPNFVVSNKHKKGGHLIWMLEVPIHKEYIEYNKALIYFAKIQQAYTKKLKGDVNYVNMITKNPCKSDVWNVWNVNHYYAYQLAELADYVELPKKILKREALGEGRNCFLFDSIRKWAYREVLFYKENGATFEDFRNVVLSRLEKNNIFENCLPLGFNELKNIAQSISKFCWKNFSVEKFSEIQSYRGKQSGKSRQEKVEKRLNEYEF